MLPALGHRSLLLHPGYRSTAGFDNGDSFFIAGNGKRHGKIFIHFAITGARHSDDVVAGSHAADLDLSSADDDAIRTDFFHMHGYIQVLLMGCFLGAVAFGVGEAAGHGQGIVFRKLHEVFDPLVIVGAQIFVAFKGTHPRGC